MMKHAGVKSNQYANCDKVISKGSDLLNHKCSDWDENVCNYSDYNIHENTLGDNLFQC